MKTRILLTVLTLILLIGTRVSANDYQEYSKAYRQDVNNMQVVRKSLSEKDMMDLAKLVFAEAESEGYEGKRLVVEVLTNRVKSNKFPNTIHDVIYHKLGNNYQFCPLNDGRFYKSRPDAETFRAIKDVILNGTKYDDIVLFQTRNVKNSWATRNGELVVKYKNHNFYRLKEK